MTKESIGGYIELDLPKRSPYHVGAIDLNTGRNCLEYILSSRKIKHIHLPLYSCSALFEPIRKLNIDYSCYHINENMEPTALPNVGIGEAFLYINYFGLKDEMVKSLSKIFGGKLIIDNSQAFFSERLPTVDTFYSARKFFGVPDGAYLYTDNPTDTLYERDTSFTRITHLLKRIDTSPEEAYADFLKNENLLCGQPIKLMSRLTTTILKSIDYSEVRKIRRSNYTFLHDNLKNKNTMKMRLDQQAPMIYPFRTHDSGLRNQLLRNHIYVATYWPNINRESGATTEEQELASQIIPLPIDHRYTEGHLGKIIENIR